MKAETEVERKWLVRPTIEFFKLIENAALVETIQQDYLYGDKVLSSRIRVTNGEVAVLTIKESTDLIEKSEEKHFSISLEGAIKHLESSYKTITKKRYHVEWVGGFVIHFDVFSGYLSGHITAEIENLSLEESIDLPSCFDKEVTKEAWAKNVNLFDSHCKGMIPRLPAAV
ncbi:hypothetical protein [Vibrio alginolyticus]|uniref:hypothetical protein n=1 Tax=Vibrio TaxID=662 RepID=UPI0006CA98B8|nr:hypothetical protein [Vibrio alginolyticus]KPM97454.1 hypothetical protein AOG25_13340 [Vibrio alginolyticus]CAH7184472.1 conserved hypothetical protein [Vibrio chagasii]CAH7353485.1 conserved hypothetical protein [Vibrio chagasii]